MFVWEKKGACTRVQPRKRNAQKKRECVISGGKHTVEEKVWQGMACLLPAPRLPWSDDHQPVLPHITRQGGVAYNQGGVFMPALSLSHAAVEKRVEVLGRGRRVYGESPVQGRDKNE